jgi:hypothetical protein
MGWSCGNSGTIQLSSSNDPYDAPCQWFNKTSWMELGYDFIFVNNTGTYGANNVLKSCIQNAPSSYASDYLILIRFPATPDIPTGGPDPVDPIPCPKPTPVDPVPMTFQPFTGLISMPGQPYTGPTPILGGSNSGGPMPLNSPTDPIKKRRKRCHCRRRKWRKNRKNRKNGTTITLG